MAIRRETILGPSIVPDSSGDVFIAPYSSKTINKVWKYLVVIFNETSTRIGLEGSFYVPVEYVSSAQIVLMYTSGVTVGNFKVDYEYRSVGGDDAESLDQTGVQELVTITSPSPTVVHNKLELLLDLTDGNFAINDKVQFKLFRDGANAADTVSDVLIVQDIFFQYSDV